MHSTLHYAVGAPRSGPAVREPILGKPLPFALLPPCHKNISMQPRTSVTGTRCLPANTRSFTWQSRAAPAPFLPAAQVPRVSDAAITHACDPLRLHTAQLDGVRSLLRDPAFWSPWLKRNRTAVHGNRTAEQRRKRCTTRMRGWRPRICQLSDVYVAGSAQVLFNGSAYFGPTPRVMAGLRPLGVGMVQAHARHAVLSRNEYGAGYYHMIFDTLASVAFLWPALKDDASAKLVLNPCSTGREHLIGKAGNAARTTAPDFAAAAACERRKYVAELLKALGITPSRVFNWPYTRQLSGPTLEVDHASFMCAHPWQSTFQRGFWYVRQLRSLLHAAFHLVLHDEPARPPVAKGGGTAVARTLLLISRKGCEAAGCDPSRNVRNGPALFASLVRAFPADRVIEFSGTEPVAQQASLFHSAVLIAGPHGAAFANAIWCRAGASLVEFHRQHWRSEPNSPLYALLSRSLLLRHWVVTDTESESHRWGYQIAPQTLVHTVRTALDVAEGRTSDAPYLVELSRDEWL